MNWERIWADARSVRDRIEEWITLKSLPAPDVYIKENPDTHPRPSALTFVARVGLLEESKVIGTDIIDDNGEDIGLFAQSLADFLYRQLVKN